MPLWLVIGLFAVAAFWCGLFVYLALNGGLHTKIGFVGIEKTPDQIAAMLAKAKAHETRYDRWRAGLNKRWGKGPRR